MRSNNDSPTTCADNGLGLTIGHVEFTAHALIRIRERLPESQGPKWLARELEANPLLVDWKYLPEWYRVQPWSKRSRDIYSVLTYRGREVVVVCANDAARGRRRIVKTVVTKEFPPVFKPLCALAECEYSAHRLTAKESDPWDGTERRYCSRLHAHLGIERARIAAELVDLAERMESGYLRSVAGNLERFGTLAPSIEQVREAVPA